MTSTQKPSAGPALAIHTHADVAMDTLVTLRVDTAQPAEAARAALDRAFHWFPVVEAACSRFDDRSELAGLATRAGIALPVSPILLEALAFALDVARLTDGAFDPTIGAVQQLRGFDRNYISGRRGAVAVTPAGEPASYLDVRIDRSSGTVLLRKPLLFDLGAVAKGLAIDLAAKELATFERYAVEAGGDLYAGGADRGAAPWRIGIRDPRAEDALLGTVAVLNGAVCTSGGCERPGNEAGEHHLLNPRTRRSPQEVAGATVLAPTAMVADALSTAAIVLGPDKGVRLLTEQGVAGLLVSSAGRVFTTAGFEDRFI